MTDNSNISAIILAAGLSTRMGSINKLLTPWHNKPLLEYVCEAATQSDCNQTIVVTGHQSVSIEKAVDKFDLLFTHNTDYKSGMASSIRAGIHEAIKQNSSAALIMLGDMPGISGGMVNTIIEASRKYPPQTIIISTNNGKRGNPLLWPVKYFDQLLRLEGDRGARQIISEYEDCIIELELGSEALFDLDTPESFH